MLKHFMLFMFVCSTQQLVPTPAGGVKLASWSTCLSINQKSACMITLLCLCACCVHSAADLEGVQLVASPVPASWSNMTSLEVLRLAFTTPAALDALPNSWGTLAALKHVAISNASFSAGGLPANWSSANALQSVTLHSVNFTAAGQQLPASWGSLNNLKVLELDKVTGLSGPLPSSWITGLSALETLHLSGVPGLNATLADYVVLVNQTFRVAGVNKTGLLSLKLRELGLNGSISAIMFNNTG